MSATSEAKAVVATELVELAREQSRVHDLMHLTKPRLTALVLLSALVGFFFGNKNVEMVLMVDMLLGTFLVAAGSSALNQVIERHTDAKMRRTKDRPLPSKRMAPAQVLYMGVAMSIIGMLYLALRVNLDAALLASATLGLYVFAYTPLKRVSSLNTLVGAVPGALPPLIGWVAARGDLNAQAWTLFAILFIWQLPHFLAIAWMYRADYSNAGMKMLPTEDAHGFSTGRQVVVHSLTLIPISILPCVFQMSGALYFYSAIVLGVAFLAFGIAFAAKRTDAAARKLFLASVIYLPLLLAVMMYDRL